MGYLVPLALPPCFLKFYDTKIPYNLQGFWHLSFPILQFIVPKGFHHKVLETLCTEKCYGKLAFQTLFVQDVYAAKGSKTFWY